MLRRVFYIMLLSGFAYSCESYFCDQNRKFYKREFKGKVVKKYKAESSGRMVEYLIFANGMDTIFLEHPALDFDSCRVGDSIYKGPNSVVFELYRNKKLITISDEDASCDYSNLK